MSTSELIGVSPKFTAVLEDVRTVAAADCSVLILGETGTGKEVIARAIHDTSPRRQRRFVAINCAAIPATLLESELFGYERGAFTGAVTHRMGHFQAADRGTLFLDEIGDLPLDIQPKLLRFLEQQEILPVGETKPQKVDVRVLAATNADLEQRVGEGKFREDLYYRLSVIRIHVPPLRERQEEIPHLSAYFLRDASERLGKPDVHLSSETLDAFTQYRWPGNVRQLKNEIQRAVAMSAPGELIQPAHLTPEISSMRQPITGSGAVRARRSGTNLAAAIEEVERDLIQTALDRAGGNMAESARLLGLTRRGLYLKLRRLGLETRQELDTH